MRNEKNMMLIMFHTPCVLELIPIENIKNILGKVYYKLAIKWLLIIIKQCFVFGETPVLCMGILS